MPTPAPAPVFATLIGFHLTDSDLSIVAHETGPHALFDDESGRFYAFGAHSVAHALALMRAHADEFGMRAPTKADARTFRLRWWRDAQPATEDDPAFTTVAPGTPGACPVLIWHARYPHIAGADATTHRPTPHAIAA